MSGNVLRRRVSPLDLPRSLHLRAMCPERKSPAPGSPEDEVIAPCAGTGRLVTFIALTNLKATNGHDHRNHEAPSLTGPRRPTPPSRLVTGPAHGEVSFPACRWGAIRWSETWSWMAYGWPTEDLQTGHREAVCSKIPVVREIACEMWVPEAPTMAAYAGP